MVDISTVGTKFTLTIGGEKIVEDAKDFSDEGTPFSIATKTQFTDSKKNMNGNMISSRTPSIIEATLSVIPDGYSDLKIRSKLQSAVLSPNKAAEVRSILVDELKFVIPANNESGHNVGNGITITLTNGRIKEGNIGISASSEGRKEAQEYTFEFEDIALTNYENGESGDGSGTTQEPTE
jgi:hypothetical protein